MIWLIWMCVIVVLVLVFLRQVACVACVPESVCGILFCSGGSEKKTVEINDLLMIIIA